MSTCSSPARRSSTAGPWDSTPTASVPITGMAGAWRCRGVWRRCGGSSRDSSRRPRRCSTPSASGRARWWPRTGTWRVSSSTCGSSRARSRRSSEPMPRTLSAEQVTEFRTRLCAVAQPRLATQGRDAVSMRQLADALGCSPMTPYRYFRNKDEILAAVRAAAFDRFADALEAAVAKERGDLRKQGEGVGEAYIRFALREREAYRLMFDLSQPHQDRYPELVRATARARHMMSASLEKLVEAGIFVGDAQLMGHVF